MRLIALSFPIIMVGVAVALIVGEITRTTLEIRRIRRIARARAKAGDE